MRGKKAKALRRVIKRQIERMAVEDKDLMVTSYEEPKKFAKRFTVLRDGKPALEDLIFTEPVIMDFCFRRAYQSLKDVVKRSGQLKNVKA